MFSYIILALIVYLLYRFVFGFLLPVISASRNMQQKLREMQANAQGFSPDEQETKRSNAGFNSSNTSTPKPSSKDYIEFEEIK
jgi:hypothetical protein